MVNFDMINMLRLDYVPSCSRWIHSAGDAVAELAVAEAASPNVHIYDGRGESAPLRTLSRIHTRPVTCMAYSHVHDVVVSADEGGMVEYWSGGRAGYEFPRKAVRFESKVETDLYEFARRKTVPLSMCLSPKNDTLAVWSADRKIRLVRLLTGKLTKVIDESVQHYNELQQVSQVRRGGTIGGGFWQGAKNNWQPGTELGTFGILPGTELGTFGIF